MAIIIDDKLEGEKLSKFLTSLLFNKIIKACLWSSFRIEWGMFKDLKKNFYELLDDKKLQQSDEINDNKLQVSKKSKSKNNDKVNIIAIMSK